VLSGTATAASWLSYTGAVSWDIGRKANTGVNDGTVYFKGSLSEIGYVQSTVWSAADQLAVYTGSAFFYAATSANFNDIVVEQYWQPQSASGNPQLSCYAQFDEASGNLVNNGYHGDTASFWATVGVTYLAAGSGMDALNTAVSMDGSTSTISVNSAGIGRYFVATGDNSGAIFMLVKLSSSQPAGAACALFEVKGDAGSGNNDRMAFFSDTATPGLLFLCNDSAGNNRSRRATSFGALQDNLWHFIAIVQRADSTNVHIFVDGVESSAYTDTTAGTPLSLNRWSDFFTYSGGISTLGNRPGAAFKMAGSLDHFSVVANVSVSDADIANLQAARSRTTSSSAAIPTMIRHVGRKVFNF
jgi:hypothetical protein